VNPDDHTRNDIPGNIRVSRKGDLLVLTTRLATIQVPMKRAKELAQAILEVSQ